MTATPSPLKAAYVSLVDALKAALPYQQAMEDAVGGGFDVIGPIEVGIIRHFGLAKDGYLIDVGCGSGRLAKPLSIDHEGEYLGIDVVPDLLAHARNLVQRPAWRFEAIDHISIPEEDGKADVVCFFSVMTHLTHEQSYWYLEEAKRVLKPGGAAIFSFLEFPDPNHWGIFQAMINNAKARTELPMNVFMGRGFFSVWAQHLGMTLEAVHGGGEAVTPAGPLGQALCVMRKPL